MSSHDPIDIKTARFPLLGALSGPGYNITPIRELTPEEQEGVKTHTKQAAKGREMFKLFKITARNYEEWTKYTNSLLTPAPQLTADETVELDRLMLNFLTAAKSVIDHFRMHYKQAFPDKEDAYDAYLARIEEHCWAHAFFQDFRNFVQHCGLPVSNYSRHTSKSTVTIDVSVDAGWLVDHYSKWGKSKLTRDHGKLDLLQLTQDYYVRLTQDLGQFVATAFAPELEPAHRFFHQLALEVHQFKPNALPVVVTAFRDEGDQLSVDYGHLPVNVFTEIGIRFSRPI